MIRERDTGVTVGVTGTAWPVNWTAVVIGALAAIVAVVLFGLMGTAIGAHKTGAEGRITAWSGVGLLGLIWAVASSFFAFVIGGWVAARIASIRTAREAILQAALAWLIAVALMSGAAAFSGAIFNGWYTGLAPTPAVPTQPGTPADPNTAIAVRNGALAAAAAILIGLMGSVIGGWLGSGEPMTLGAGVRLGSGPEADRLGDRTRRTS